MNGTALNHGQQHELFTAAHAMPVTLIGAGSVGSQVAVALAKIGVTDLTVWDADDVESHNIPVSAYRLKDLGVVKVRALADILGEQAGVAITAVEKMYAGEPLRGAVVACVDSMEARQKIWSAAKGDPLVDILIDTRVASEYVSVFAVNPSDPDDIAYYEYFLRYTYDEAVKPMCGYHGIYHVAATAAVAVNANLTNWWSNGRKERHYKKLVRDLRQVTA
jgi:hypothetical protein